MTSSYALIEAEAESVIESDGRMVNTYTHLYLYKTDAPSRPSFATIAADIGIYPGSPYGDDINATANRSHLKTLPTRAPYLRYIATFTWSTGAPLPASVSTDPTTRRIIWSVRPTIQSTYVTEDRLGKLIVNGAKQPFDGGVPVDVRYGTVVARRNVDAAGYDKTAVLANSGKLNSLTYLGGAPETVQVDIESEEHYEGSYHYWAETYTFSYNPRTWQPRPANAGFFQLVGGVLREITNGDIGSTVDALSPVREPEPLDLAGLLVPIASRPASCTFIDVDYYDTLDFATTFGF